MGSHGEHCFTIGKQSKTGVLLSLVVVMVLSSLLSLLFWFGLGNKRRRWAEKEKRTGNQVGRIYHWWTHPPGSGLHLFIRSHQVRWMTPEGKWMNLHLPSLNPNSCLHLLTSRKGGVHPGLLKKTLQGSVKTNDDSGVLNWRKLASVDIQSQYGFTKSK